MADVTIRVDGLRELNSAFRKLGRDATNDLKGTHAAAARVVQSKASVLVPKRSGTLAGSIRSSGTMRGGVVRAGRARVPYAGPIHFGWAKRNISPQPFLYDALDDRRDEVIERYATEMRSLIRRYNL